MSIRVRNRQRGSSRKKRSSASSESDSVHRISSPWIISIFATRPGFWPVTCSPSCCSPSVMTMLSFSAGDGAGPADLLLQLQNAVQQSLRRRRTAGNIDIDRHDTVAAADDGIGVVIIAAAIGAGAHGDHPARLGHLAV